MASTQAFRLYRLAVWFLACAAFLTSVLQISRLPPPIDALFLVSYVVLQVYEVVLPGGAALRLGSAIALAALGLRGPAFATLVVGLGAAAAGALCKSPGGTILLNWSMWVLSVSTAARVFEVLASTSLGALASLAVAVLAYECVNILLASLAMTIYKARPLATTLGDLGGSAIALGFLGDSMAVALAALVPVLGIPAALAGCTGLGLLGSVALRRAAALRHTRLLENFVSRSSGCALDGTQGTPKGGDALLRVANELASYASLPPDQADALRWAALLHDSGFSEAAVAARASSEPLSDDELAEIKEHPLRAALKVGQVGNLLWVARILETHHEHHNGWGYPFGLKGDEIPLPAALLGLAEAYLALTTPRPYRRKVMTPSQALRYLQSRAGEQFSPAAVAALEKWLASGAAKEDPAAEEAGRREAQAAAERLRRLAGRPRLPRHESLTGPGSDLWFRGLGGPGRFFERLFALNPLRVRSRERDLPAQWYRSLLDLSRVFNSSLDVQFIARRLADVVHGLTTLPCIVHLLKDDNVTLAPAAVSGLPESAVSDLRQGIGEGLLGLAITEGRPVTSLDLTEDPRSVQNERARVLGVRSSVCVPLKAGETALGAFSVGSPTVRRFPPSEVRALAALGDVAALALHNALLYRKAATRLERLMDSQLHLRTVLDTVPSGILTLGRDGRPVSCNRQALRYLSDLGLAEALGEAAGSAETETAFPAAETTASDAVTPAADEGFPAATAATAGVTAAAAAAAGPDRGSAAAPEPGPGPAAAEDGREGREDGEDMALLLLERLGARAPLEAREKRRPSGPDTVSAVLPSGEERFFAVWASPLRDSAGRAAGLLVVFDDVTEPKRLAAEVQRTEKLAAVGEVAAKAAHEIKNPLASIRGLIQLLGLYCPVRDQWTECPRYVGLVTEEIDRLAEIAQSMLTLARPARPELVPGDLTDIVDETISLLSGKASAQGTVLERPAGPGRSRGPGGARGVVAEFDPRQVKQVLLNLVQNALDAVAGPGGPPPGWRKVTLSVGYTRRDERRLAFVQVRDNGPGIRAEDRPKLFTPFFTTKETGTGLGLAISKSIAEAHGGFIEVRAARGRGCVFELFLPAAIRSRAAAVEAASARACPEGDGPTPAKPGSTEGFTQGRR